MDAFERIIVGIDLSKTSRPLAQFMIDFASRYGSELIFTYVVDEVVIEHAAAGYDPNKIINSYVEEARKELEGLVQLALSRGVRARYTIYDNPADPSVALALVAEEEHASEIAVAHKGHKLFRVIPVGSTALGLVSHSPVPVLVVRARKEGDEVIVEPREGVSAKDLLRKIVIAIDESVSDDMVEYIKSMILKARKYVEEVYVLHVVEPGHDPASSKRLVENVVSRISSAHSNVRSIMLEGHKPYKDILAASNQLEATLLVVGRRVSKRKIVEVILGGTLRRIIEACDIPVLVYPLEKT